MKMRASITNFMAMLCMLLHIPDSVADEQQQEQEFQKQRQAFVDQSVTNMILRYDTLVSRETIEANREQIEKLQGAEFDRRWKPWKSPPDKTNNQERTAYEKFAQKHCELLINEAGKALQVKEKLQNLEKLKNAPITSHLPGTIDKVIWQQRSRTGSAASFRVELVNGKLERAIILYSESLLEKSYRTKQLLVAAHELVHAEQFEKLLKESQSPEKAVEQWNNIAANRFGPEYTRNEIEAETRARTQIQIWLGGLNQKDQDETGQYIEEHRDHLSWLESRTPADVQIEDTPPEDDNTGHFREKLAKVNERLRQLLKTGADRLSRFRAVLRRLPVMFGGVVLGNATDPRSVTVRKATIRINEQGLPYLDFIVEGANGKPHRCRYDEFTLTELWSAYHIVRPTAEMRKKYGVASSECNLIDCETNFRSVKSQGSYGIHPALANTRLGAHLKWLDLLLLPSSVEKSFPEIDQKNIDTWQWYDSEALITFEDNKIKVLANEGPRDILLRLRFWGKNPKAKPAWAKESGDLKQAQSAEFERRLYHRAAFGRKPGDNQSVYLNRDAYLDLRSEIHRGLNQELCHDIPVDAAERLRQLRTQHPSLQKADRFAKLLAILHWIEDTKEVALPAWPTNLKPHRVNLPPTLNYTAMEMAMPFRLLREKKEKNSLPTNNWASVSEDWFSIQKKGQKIGHGHYLVEKYQQGGKEYRKSTFQSQYQRQLSDDFYVEKLEWNATLTPQGHLLDCRLAGISTGNNYHLAAKIENGKYYHSANHKGWGNGKPCDSPVYGPLSWMQNIREKPMKRKEKRTLQIVNRWLLLTPLQLYATNWEDISLLNGKRLKVLRIEVMDKKYLHFILWANQQGEILKIHPQSNLPPGDAEWIRTTRLQALKGLTLLKAESEARLELDKPLTEPRELDRVRIRIRATIGNLSNVFPSTLRQRVTVIDKQTVEIEMRSQLLDQSQGKGQSKPGDSYTQPSHFVDSDHASVKAMAKKLLGSMDIPWHVALNLERHLYFTMRYTSKKSWQRASEVAEKKQGDFRAYASLLTALCQSRKIPARIVDGYKYSPNQQGFLWHTWSEVWVNNHWLPLDAVYGRGGIGATYLRLRHHRGNKEDFIHPSKRMSVLNPENVTVTLIEQHHRSLQNDTLPKANVVPEAKPKPAVNSADQRKVHQEVIQLAEQLARATFRYRRGITRYYSRFDEKRTLAKNIAKKLGVVIPEDSLPPQGNSYLRVFNEWNYLNLLAEPVISAQLQKKYGQQASSLYLLVSKLLRTGYSANRLLQCPDVLKRLENEIEIHAQQAKIPKELWQPLLSMIRQRKPNADIISVTWKIPGCINAELLPAFHLNVEVNRKDRIFLGGEKMKLTVQSNRKGYLYLFLQAPRGNWHCLLPEKEKQELIPAQGKIQLTLPIKAPFGKLKFKALISEQPLKNVKRASILSGMDLKQIELKLEQLKAKQRWSWGSNSLEVTTLDPNK